MGISNKDKSINLLNKHSYSGSDLLKVNYCIPGIMSRCSAGLTWHDQKKCKFAKKSSVSNRCMHYIEPINGHCDSVEAQSELRNLDRFEDDG